MHEEGVGEGLEGWWQEKVEGEGEGRRRGKGRGGGGGRGGEEEGEGQTRQERVHKNAQCLVCNKQSNYKYSVKLL